MAFYFLFFCLIADQTQFDTARVNSDCPSPWQHVGPDGSSRKASLFSINAFALTFLLKGEGLPPSSYRIFDEDEEEVSDSALLLMMS